MLGYEYELQLGKLMCVLGPLGKGWSWGQDMARSRDGGESGDFMAPFGHRIFIQPHSKQEEYFWVHGVAQGSPMDP